MDRSSLIVVVIPIVIPIALFTGMALPFVAASRSGRSHARRRLASADARKRTGAAGRKARPQKPRAHDDALAGYLYVPCVHNPHNDYSAGTRRWVQQVPIVKKTAKLIYYTSDSWDRRQAVVSPGCISREQFETDTRCHDTCPRDIAAGLVCAPHGRGHRHCVHVLAPGRHCHAPGGCGDDCPADTRGWRCAQHGYTWEHCPHGEDRCRRGYPADVIPVPGHRHRPGPAAALLRHPPGRRRTPVPQRKRASPTCRTASTTHQGTAPRHGRCPPRPGRHRRAVHPSAPPVSDSAPGRARVTCSPRRLWQTRPRTPRDEQMTAPAKECPPVTRRNHAAAVGRGTTRPSQLA